MNVFIGIVCVCSSVSISLFSNAFTSVVIRVIGNCCTSVFTGASTSVIADVFTSVCTGVFNCVYMHVFMGIVSVCSRESVRMSI